MGLVPWLARDTGPSRSWTTCPDGVDGMVSTTTAAHLIPEPTDAAARNLAALPLPSASPLSLFSLPLNFLLPLASPGGAPSGATRPARSFASYSASCLRQRMLEVQPSVGSFKSHGDVDGAAAGSPAPPAAATSTALGKSRRHGATVPLAVSADVQPMHDREPLHGTCYRYDKPLSGCSNNSRHRGARSQTQQSP